jgi:leucyl-tRNA synthetase
MHTVLAQVDYDYQRLQYNTVVSGAMKMLNALEGFKSDGHPSDGAALAEGFSILLRALYPATPHIAHALWQQLGFAARAGDVLNAPWPQPDPVALRQDEVELMLQINGKLRGAIAVPAGAGREQIEQAALASEAFAKHGGAVKRVIVVPGRLVNVVVR